MEKKFVRVAHLNIFRLRACSRQNADIKRCLGAPLPVLATLLQPLEITNLRHDGEEHKVFSHSKVVNHSHNWRNEPHHLEELAIRSYSVIAHIRRPISFGLIPKANHLARLGVELGMGCERQTGKLPIKSVQAQGLEGFWVQCVRRGVFLESEQLAVEVDDVGVGCSADFELDRIGVLVAVLSQQGPLGLAFSLQLLSLDIFLLERDFAVFDPESADGAISVEPL